MCFSATASFATSLLTGAIGLATLSRARTRNERMLAAMPLIFSAQQAIEGCLWLNLGHDGPEALSTGLAILFVFFAQVLWPVYAPVAVLMVEADPLRRRALALSIVAGLAISLFLLWGMIAAWPTARLIDGHIVYSTAFAHPLAMILVYLMATGIAMLLSSHRTVFWLGLVVTAGSAVSSIFYYEAFVSVWCFFAAAASGVILLHFERQRRLSGLPAVKPA